MPSLSLTGQRRPEWPVPIWVTEIGVSQAEPPVAAEAPVDPATRAGDAGDVAPELLFEGGRPGHELEAQAVVDHGEAAECERALFKRTGVLAPGAPAPLREIT